MTYYWHFSDADAIKYGASRLLDLECLQRYVNKHLSYDWVKEKADSTLWESSPPEYDVVDEVIDDWCDDIRDAFYELEPIETNIPAPDSRHYDAESVALMCCGHWVGWTQWTGGGKHGCPEDIDKDPYLLKVTDQRVVKVTQYTFDRLEVA
jgi:hypothetical protein